jgi:hypothetical protein
VTVLELSKPKFLNLHGFDFTYQIVFDVQTYKNIKLFLTGILGYCLGQYGQYTTDALLYLAIFAMIKETATYPKFN